ncbi:MAG: efflux RND transporter periplasmic adaptor subunit [Verrucomicrobiae bacterium]|nr:efflux RND transporter periplasmic adaptor subunit [Verrucomicrobiae bacterium]
MKAPTLLAILLTAALVGPAAWWSARRLAQSHDALPAAGGPKRVLFYQSAMHPWIKSDTPGKCTICGMELTPVFEGDASPDLEPGMVSLPSNSITVIHVRSTSIHRGPLVRHLRVAGTLEPDETRRRLLPAYVAGRIEHLHVNFTGASVTAGQPLARIYSPALLEAERQFLALARHTPGAPSADADLLQRAAFQRLRQLGLTEPQILALPGKDPASHLSELLAPESGTVLERFVLAGQYVAEGDPLLEIADLSTLWFRFDVYERDLPWIRVGQEVELTTPALPGQSLHAPIRFIDPTLDPRTRSAKARVELDNPLLDPAHPQHLLPAQLYADARIRIEIPGVLLVPRAAVLNPDGRPRAYLDHGGGAYERRDLRLGRAGDDHFEVLAGLDAGDRVVLNGNLLIDAQAQLNQSLHEPGLDPAASPDPASPALTPPRPPPNSFPTDLLPALQAFLAQADLLRAALAADDLAAFNDARPALAATAVPLRERLPAAGPWQPWIEPALSPANLPPAPSLRDARGAYFPLSQALVALAKSLRDAEPGFASLRIYRCPMTSDAFADAPRRTEWLQLAPPLRNPWFGAEMLECGVEVVTP